MKAWLGLACVLTACGGPPPRAPNPTRPLDERRAIFEHKSQHIASSLKYLPAIARQLYHSRDLGEPFDFLTWFEYAPEHADAFEELVGTLRASEEWKYVEREVDIRMERERLDAD